MTVTDRWVRDKIVIDKKGQKYVLFNDFQEMLEQIVN